MKRILLLLLFCLPLLSIAQKTESKKDTTRFKMGSTTFTIIKDKTNKDSVTVDMSPNDSSPSLSEKEEEGDKVENEDSKPGYDEQKKSKKKKVHTHWAGVDLGVNGYMNADGGTNAPANYPFLDLNYSRSRYVSLNFLRKDGKLISDKLFFCTGLAFDWYNYHFTENYTLLKDTNMVAANKESFGFDKNKMAIASLTAPLLFELHLGENNKFHIAAGASISYRFYTWTKQKYTENNKKEARKDHDDYNVAPFGVNGMVRIGYGAFTLFGNYCATGLFEKGRGPDLYPFSVGICLAGF